MFANSDVEMGCLQKRAAGVNRERSEGPERAWEAVPLARRVHFWAHQFLLLLQGNVMWKSELGRLISIVVLFVFLGACATPTPTEEPREMEPGTEEAPEDDERAEMEERAAEEMMEMREEMQAERDALIEQYEELEEAYEELEDEAVLDEAILAGMEEFREMHQEMAERRERMEEGRGEGMGRPMEEGQRQEMGMMRERHGAMVELHEELAQMNREAGREELAELHEGVMSRHARMESMCEMMLERMEEME